ncbi:30S ribosomal protein S12 methylthiotransferase RimO [bacterium]|nr:30S ribosomal protein S12 methylthiotransferase RimO [bacterium]
MIDTPKFKKVTLVTLGCPKNEVDSEFLAGELSRQGLILVDDAESADLIIINTCGFIEAAKRESIDAILSATTMKEEYPDKRVIVWGCLSERYKNEIKNEIPEVDAYFGVESFQDIGKWLCGQRYRVPSDVHKGRILSTPTHVAYLKIADGCDHKCSFCAIPGIKGAFHSRSMESLLEEAQILVAAGVKELILIAQDTSRYGVDLEGDITLVSLLRQLIQICGLEWIRIMYVHPLHLTEELIDIIADEPKIVKYIDMPLQHISDNVLCLMKRGHDGKRVDQLLKRMKRRIPDLVLRTAFIVGFPGESEADFEELLDFVETVRFDRMGAFIYSKEEGTSASLLADEIPIETAQYRFDSLMAVQLEISEAHNEKYIGSIISVIVDGYDDIEELHYGRSQGDGLDIDQLVWINGKPPIGQIVFVLIESSSTYDLYGSWRI